MKEDDTNKFYLSLFKTMEQRFFDQEGIAILVESEEKKRLGKFIGADISAVAPLLKFERETVLFLIPEFELIIVGEQEKSGTHTLEEWCKDVLIGGTSFYVHIQDIMKSQN